MAVSTSTSGSNPGSTVSSSVSYVPITNLRLTLGPYLSGGQQRIDVAWDGGNFNFAVSVADEAGYEFSDTRTSAQGRSYSGFPLGTSVLPRVVTLRVTDNTGAFGLLEFPFDAPASSSTYAPNGVDGGNNQLSTSTSGSNPGSTVSSSSQIPAPHDITAPSGGAIVPYFDANTGLWKINFSWQDGQHGHTLAITDTAGYAWSQNWGSSRTYNGAPLGGSGASRTVTVKVTDSLGRETSTSFLFSAPSSSTVASSSSQASTSSVNQGDGIPRWLDSSVAGLVLVPYYSGQAWRVDFQWMNGLGPYFVQVQGPGHSYTETSYDRLVQGAPISNSGVTTITVTDALGRTVTATAQIPAPATTSSQTSGTTSSVTPSTAGAPLIQLVTEQSTFRNDVYKLLVYAAVPAGGADIRITRADNGGVLLDWAQFATGQEILLPDVVKAVYIILRSRTNHALTSPVWVQVKADDDGTTWQGYDYVIYNASDPTSTFAPLVYVEATDRIQGDYRRDILITGIQAVIQSNEPARLVGWRLSEMPQHGYLTLDGAPVNLGQQLAFDAVNRLRYSASPVFVGTDRFSLVAIATVGESNPLSVPVFVVLPRV